MNTPIEVVAKIRASGGSISVVNGEIKVSAPAGTLSPEDRLALAEHRETLISILPSTDPEREAIQWADTPAADQALDRARQEWAEIVGVSVYDQIESVIERTFAEGGIEVSAKFDRASEAITIKTVQDGDWREPPRGSFVIPAGTEGRLVVDLDATLADDPRELCELRRTIKTEQLRGRDPVAVDLDGRVRVLDRSKIRLSEPPPAAGGDTRGMPPSER